MVVGIDVQLSHQLPLATAEHHHECGHQHRVEQSRAERVTQRGTDSGVPGGEATEDHRSGPECHQRDDQRHDAARDVQLAGTTRLVERTDPVRTD